jgi:hypothetical protein
MSRSPLGVVLRGLPACGRSVTFLVWRKRCIGRTMMFAVFVACTHTLTYPWNRLLIDFYLCVYDRVCKVRRVLFNICDCERTLIYLISNIPRLTKTLHRSYNDEMVNPEVDCHPSMAKTTAMHANSLPPVWYG